MKRRRKENYGFNEFNSVKFVSIFMMSISISILLLSIGFSSFNKNLFMSNAKVMVRADKDVRISGIKVRGNAKSYSNGDVVYFNVTTGEKCSSSDYTVSQSNVGVKEGCMKFYAFNDDDGKTINLLLDHNTTDKVAWNDTYTDNGEKINAKGPKEVLDQLKKDTASWLGTETPENYTMDQTGQTSNAKYTINYSTYKARLITAQEVATITNYSGWDEKTASSLYYFDSKTISASTTCKSGNTSGCKYGWLYDRTSTDCKTYGCLNNSDQSTRGYWTSSSIANYALGAWIVSFESNITNGDVISPNNYGVRPVITVAKEKLSNEGLSGAISNNEEYLDSSIYGDITLPASDSAITYEVEITNLGNVKVAVADIINEESRLTYELEDYTLGETICDTNNACTNGIKKKIYVTLKYNDGVTPTSSSIPFNLKFDFEQVYKVTYDEVTCDGCKTEALGNSPFTVTISLLNPKIIMNDRELTESEYSYVNGLLTINNVDGDIIIGEGQPPVLCTSVSTATTGNIPDGSFNYGDEYTCDLGDTDGTKNLTFFVLEKDEDNVSLIMSENITDSVAWITKEDYLNAGGAESDWDKLCTDCGNNSLGPITASKALSENTKIWTKLKQGQINLPTGQQIATAAGQSFDQSSEFSVSIQKDWLSGNSYWTSTPVIGRNPLAPNGAWYMNETRMLSDFATSASGIRPVITISKSQILQKYGNGQIVYFNVTTGTKCSSTSYTEAQSNIGVNSGCMKFYAFNDDGGDTVNLILDHSTTASVDWNSNESNTNGPSEVLSQLKTDTASWKGTEIPSNYSIDQSSQTSKAKYTIDYSDYKARLITANEVAQITGNTSFDEENTDSYFYFDSNTSTASSTCKSGNTSGCSYGWLYDRTSTYCTTYGCLNNSDQTTYGYWSASSFATKTGVAWGVFPGNSSSSGSFFGGSTVGGKFADGSGVRPVITVLKSNLVDKNYNITTNLTNVSGNSSNATSIKNIETKTLKFTANSGYSLPSDVTVTGATYTWDKTTGELTLSEIYEDVVISISGIELKTYKNGEVVYFNVTTGTKCSSTSYTEAQSNTGVNSGCMKFYAFNDTGGSELNLLLDHNTTATIAWNSSKSNTSGPKEVLDQLKTDTASWKGTKTPANYTMDQSTQSSKASYTIDYSDYKARLITAQEIATITENTSWDETVASSSNWYYFHSKSSTGGACTSGCTYGWLYDRTNTNCTDYGCLNNSDQKDYGYWTASSRASNSSYAWIVYYYGYVHYDGVVASSYRGVRPVITVLKANLE